VAATNTVSNWIKQARQFNPVSGSEILWLNTHEFLPAKPVPGAQCRALSAKDIQRLSLISEFDIDKQLAQDFEALGFKGIGIFVNEKLAGLSLFSTGDIAAQYNKTADHFNGIQIDLPPGARCLFKAVILPEFRGQRLHSAVVRFAIDHFGKDTVNAFITTCSSTNKAFLASSLDQGFERVGKATEVCAFGKSIYKLPKPIDSQTGEVSKDEEGCFVMHKPGYKQAA